MKITLIISLAIMSFLMSCNLNETEVNRTTVKMENSHDLKLNQGERWTVAPEMLKSIQEIESEIKNFKGTTKQDFKNYSKRISELLNELTSNCTMEGDAHDELHKWLVPFIDLNDKLINSNSNDLSSEIVTKQKEEMKLFNTYFK